MGTIMEESKLCRDIIKLKSALELFGVGQNIYASYWLKKAKKSGCIGYGRKPASIVSIDGRGFANAIFPFLMDDKKQVLAVAEVNPYNVFGGQYYNIPQRDADEEIWFMEELNRHTVAGDLERAIYIKVGPFPFYIPIEGKNRVTLFGKHNRKIACLLKEYKYPDPQDMQIVRYGQFMTLRHADPSKLNGVVTPAYQFVNPGESILAFHQSYDILREYGVNEVESRLRPWMVYKFEKARMITQCSVSENCYIR